MTQNKRYYIVQEGRKRAQVPGRVPAKLMDTYVQHTHSLINSAKVPLPGWASFRCQKNMEKQQGRGRIDGVQDSTTGCLYTPPSSLAPGSPLPPTHFQTRCSFFSPKDKKNLRPKRFPSPLSALFPSTLERLSPASPKDDNVAARPGGMCGVKPSGMGGSETTKKRKASAKRQPGPPSRQ